MTEYVFVERTAEQQRPKHLGLLCLNTDPTVEYDFRRALEGTDVKLLVNRVNFTPPVNNENLKRVGSKIVESAELLVPDEPLDYLVYCCTSCATNLGDQCIIDILGDSRPGIPNTNPATAGKIALQALGIDKIGLVTPYIQEVCESVAGYFEDAGITVTTGVYMNCETDYDISRVSRQSLIDAAVDASKDADAVFLSCAALAAVDVVEEIEQITDKPVVTSNSSMIWLVLNHFGITVPAHIGMLKDYQPK